MFDVLMHTYHRLPVSFVHGNGALLTGSDGRVYLDFTAGIAVNCLGHNHPEVAAAIKEQAAKLLHVSNYYQSDVSMLFAERLALVSGMRRVFFCNSGAEANEGAIKIARKYSLKKYGPGRHKILTLEGSFHGRTITTLSATGQDRFHTDFGPFTSGFVHIPPNDVSALENALDGTVAGLFIEPIQGESGVNLISDIYIKRAAEICAEQDVLFMVDEVQTGMGRTGKFFACSHAGVKPDIATLAKGLAAGIPAGAVLAGEKTADVLGIGDHGSTFGGNALAAAAGNVVLQKLSSEGFMAEIAALGNHLINQLKGLENESITQVRGRGLMAGCDIDRDAWPVLERLLGSLGPGGRGLLVLSAGQRTLRFLPPYIISRTEIDEGAAHINKVLLH